MAAASYLKNVKPLRLRYLGNPVLKKKCISLDVKTIRRGEVQGVFDQLTDLMMTEKSSSLAASQVGKAYRFFAMEKVYESSFLDRTTYETENGVPRTNDQLDRIHTGELTFDLDDKVEEVQKLQQAREEFLLRRAEDAVEFDPDSPNANGLEDPVPPEDSVALPVEMIVNPEWEPMGEREHSFYEMSMSCPGMCLKKTRPAFIRAKWLDRLGNQRLTYMQGFDARIFQHMCEHLDGKLYTDGCSPADIVWEDEVARRDQHFHEKIEAIMDAMTDQSSAEFDDLFDSRYPPDSEDLFHMLTEFVKKKHGFTEVPSADPEESGDFESAYGLVTRADLQEPDLRDYQDEDSSPVYGRSARQSGHDEPPFDDHDEEEVEAGTEGGDGASANPKPARQRPKLQPKKGRGEIEI